ncbi:MAG: FMN-binding protein [Pseudobdellovibrionaceae bacterium]
MKYLVLYLLAGLICIRVPAEEMLSLQAYLKSELSSSAKATKETFAIEAKQMIELRALAPSATEEQFVFYFGKSAGGQIEKSCVVVPQMGKEGPMTVGVCFDPKGLVTAIQILSSQEDRGKKATEAAFLKQFQGKKLSDAFQVGQDVDGVSGATWTSKAVAEAIRKSAFAFQKYVKGKL